MTKSRLNDEAGQAEERKTAKVREDQLRYIFIRVMNIPEGRRLMSYVLGRCGFSVGRMTSVARYGSQGLDVSETLRCLGQRESAQGIFNELMEYAPQECALMVKEDIELLAKEASGQRTKEKNDAPRDQDRNDDN